MDSSHRDVAKASSLTVAVRIKPICNKNDIAAVKPSEHPKTIQVESNISSKYFSFDFVYWPRAVDEKQSSTQNSVFEDLGIPIVKNALQGFNCSLFAYGQTGSGKTYTMYGDLQKQEKGLVPLIAESLFNEMPSTPLNCKGKHALSQISFLNSSAMPRSPAGTQARPLTPTDHTSPKKNMQSPSYLSRSAPSTPTSNTSFDQDVFNFLSDAEDETNFSFKSTDTVCSEDSQYCYYQVSFVEIYCEKVRDLLDPRNLKSERRSLKVREHPKHGPYVEGALSIPVTSCGDIHDLLEHGKKRRMIGSTSMNADSSRSHTIFTINLTKAEYDSDLKTYTEVTSKVNMVDLAGSENTKKAETKGQRRKEGSRINTSLLTLGRIIKDLSSPSPRKSNKQDKSDGLDRRRSLSLRRRSRSSLTTRGGAKKIPPYRESVLTYLLKESLGGNSNTTMIATVRPGRQHTDETLSTLRYATTAMNIINQTYVVEDPQTLLIKDLRKKILELETNLKEVVHEKEAARVEDVRFYLTENQGFVDSSTLLELTRTIDQKEQEIKLLEERLEEAAEVSTMKKLEELSRKDQSFSEISQIIVAKDVRIKALEDELETRSNLGDPGETEDSNLEYTHDDVVSLHQEIESLKAQLSEKQGIEIFLQTTNDLNNEEILSLRKDVEQLEQNNVDLKKQLRIQTRKLEKLRKVPPMSPKRESKAWTDSKKLSPSSGAETPKVLQKLERNKSEIHQLQLEISNMKENTAQLQSTIRTERQNFEETTLLLENQQTKMTKLHEELLQQNLEKNGLYQMLEILSAKFTEISEGDGNVKLTSECLKPLQILSNMKASLAEFEKVCVTFQDAVASDKSDSAQILKVNETLQSFIRKNKEKVQGYIQEALIQRSQHHLKAHLKEDILSYCLKDRSKEDKIADLKGQLESLKLKYTATALKKEEVQVAYQNKCQEMENLRICQKQIDKDHQLVLSSLSETEQRLSSTLARTSNEMTIKEKEMKIALDNVQSKLGNKSSQIEALHKDLQQKLEQINCLEFGLQQANDLNNQQRSEIQHHDLAQAKLEESLAEMMKRNASFAIQIEELQAAQVELGQQLGDMHNLNNDLKSQVEQYQTNEDKLQRQLKEMENILKDFESKVEQDKSNKSILEKKFDELHQTNAELVLKVKEHVISHGKQQQAFELTLQANSDLKSRVQEYEAIQDELRKKLQLATQKEIKLEEANNDLKCKGTHLVSLCESFQIQVREKGEENKALRRACLLKKLDVSDKAKEIAALQEMRKQHATAKKRFDAYVHLRNVIVDYLFDQQEILLSKIKVIEKDPHQPEGTDNASISEISVSRQEINASYGTSYHNEQRIMEVTSKGETQMIQPSLELTDLQFENSRLKKEIEDLHIECSIKEQNSKALVAQAGELALQMASQSQEALALKASISAKNVEIRLLARRSSELESSQRRLKDELESKSQVFDNLVASLQEKNDQLEALKSLNQSEVSSEASYLYSPDTKFFPDQLIRGAPSFYQQEKGNEQLQHWLKDQMDQSRNSTEEVLEQLSHSDTKIYHRPPPKEFMRSGSETASMSLTGDQFHLAHAKPDSISSPTPRSMPRLSPKPFMKDVPQGRSQITLCGYMMKRGFLNTSYKRRWFMLKDAELMYFKQYETDNAKPRGIIKLLGSRILEANDEVERGFPFSFMLSTPMDQKLWIFDTCSHREKKIWIEFLSQASVVRHFF